MRLASCRTTITIIPKVTQEKKTASNLATPKPIR